MFIVSNPVPYILPRTLKSYIWLHLKIYPISAKSSAPPPLASWVFSCNSLLPDLGASTPPPSLFLLSAILLKCKSEHATHQLKNLQWILMPLRVKASILGIADKAQHAWVGSWRPSLFDFISYHSSPLPAPGTLVL